MAKIQRMENILDTIVFNNPVRQWLISLTVIAAVFLFKRHIAQIFAWSISRLFEVRSKTQRVKDFQELVIPPIGLFVFVWVLIIQLHRLVFPDFLDFEVYQTTFQSILEAIGRATLIGSFIWLCNRIILFVSFILESRAEATPDRNDDQFVIFFRDFFKVILFVIGILLIIKFAFGFPLNNILTGISIIGAALALSFKESLENLIASFIIFFDKPFTTGDLVVVEGITGEVERIGLRSTRIRTADKTYVTVPNKRMVDSILNNQTLASRRRTNNPVLLSPYSQPEDILGFINDVNKLLEEEKVLEKVVYFSETGKNAQVVTIDYFVGMHIPFAEFTKLRQRVNLNILDLLEKHNLKLAATTPAVEINMPAADANNSKDIP